MEVLLEDERLNTSAHKEQSRIEEAMPQRAAQVVDKADQQPAKDQKILFKKYYQLTCPVESDQVSYTDNI